MNHSKRIGHLKSENAKLRQKVADLQGYVDGNDIPATILLCAEKFAYGMATVIEELEDDLLMGRFNTVDNGSDG